MRFSLNPGPREIGKKFHGVRDTVSILEEICNVQSAVSNSQKLRLNACGAVLSLVSTSDFRRKNRPPNHYRRCRLKIRRTRGK